MRILTREELSKCPNGTVFLKYSPEITDGNFHILSGRYGKNDWNGEVLLEPTWDNAIYHCGADTPFPIEIPMIDEHFVNWSSTDNAKCDYDEKQLFIVLSKLEVQQIINILIWSISNCEGYFDEDFWFCGNKIYTESKIREMFSDDE